MAQANLPVRRQYSDAEKWRAYNHLLSTATGDHPKGNVKRTARECYLSVSTLRTWINGWTWRDGAYQNPPATPSDEE
jgi:transposase-like protein